MTPSDKFAKQVGIHLEPEAPPRERKTKHCEMCRLLHIDIERQRGETAHRESLVYRLMEMLSAQHRIINMWRLATVVAVIWALLMTWASVRHG